MTILGINTGARAHKFNLVEIVPFDHSILLPTLLEL